MTPFKLFLVIALAAALGCTLGAQAAPEPVNPHATPEAREFAVIEGKVAASDARLSAARGRVESPEIATNAAALQEALLELEAAQQENDAIYAR